MISTRRQWTLITNVQATAFYQLYARELTPAHRTAISRVMEWQPRVGLVAKRNMCLDATREEKFAGYFDNMLASYQSSAVRYYDRNPLSR